MEGIYTNTTVRSLECQTNSRATIIRIVVIIEFIIAILLMLRGLEYSRIDGGLIRLFR